MYYPNNKKYILEHTPNIMITKLLKGPFPPFLHYSYHIANNPRYMGTIVTPHSSLRPGDSLLHHISNLILSDYYVV